MHRDGSSAESDDRIGKRGGGGLRGIVRWPMIGRLLNPPRMQPLIAIQEMSKPMIWLFFSNQKTTIANFGASLIPSRAPEMSAARIGVDYPKVTGRGALQDLVRWLPTVPDCKRYS